MRQLKIAMLQICPAGSLEKNLEKGIAYCQKAKQMGADIALFPEMWSNGYNIYGRPKESWFSEAIGTDSPFVKRFQLAAKTLQMAIGVTFLESCGTGPKNTLILFDRYGKFVFKYSKIHTCDFDDEKYLTPGSSFHTAQLDTALGKVQVGAMICFDREFPESARVLMLKGAELILVPNACPMEINRLSQLRSRAFENMLCVATCNYPSGVPDCNGHSSVFDGIAFKEEDPSYDMCLLEAGEEEGIYMASLDLEALRDYRRKESFGSAYRHPQKYQDLIREEKEAPFIRKDYRP